MNDQIPTVGILGGGQLGRMFIQEAINLNVPVHILDPDPEAPCKHLAAYFQCGSLLDYDTVLEFGMQCDVITIEIETVNTSALKELRSKGKEVWPQPEIIELIQDKRKQKTFYKEKGIPTAPFVLTENKEEVRNFTSMLPAVHKLGRGGYDGRGVQVLASASDLDKAFDAPGLLESFVAFEKELAVIVSRNASGQIASFPVVECEFHPEANLVEFLFCPAEISPQKEIEAQELARRVIEELGMVGLLAVELFLTKEGELLVNEIAPRPHNSGHHTIEGNMASQFAQHLRAILDLPPASTALRQAAAMVNILGEEGFSGQAIYKGLKEALAEKGVYVHLYGKTITKPFRKMGHATVLSEDVVAVKEKARRIKETIKVIA
jgi:5-(carboxyamino)imidazole ribonucleotide synthase